MSDILSLDAQNIQIAVAIDSPAFVDSLYAMIVGEQEDTEEQEEHEHIEEKDAFCTKQECRAVLEAIRLSGIIEEGSDVNIPRFYDLFSQTILFLRESNLPVTTPNAQAQLEASKKIAETVHAANPYSALGTSFSSLLFENDMMREVADAQRLRTGPAKMEGLYPCRKCHAPKEKTTSEVRQMRRADEPPTILNVCNVCGARWNVG